MASVDTKFIRRHFSVGPTAYREDGTVLRWPTPSDVRYCEQKFDEWLAEIVRAARAEGWDRGNTSGQSFVRRQWSDEPGLEGPVNPYEA